VPPPACAAAGGGAAARRRWREQALPRRCCYRRYRWLVGCRLRQPPAPRHFFCPPPPSQRSPIVNVQAMGGRRQTHTSRQQRWRRSSPPLWRRRRQHERRGARRGVTGRSRPRRGLDEASAPLSAAPLAVDTAAGSAAAGGMCPPPPPPPTDCQRRTAAGAPARSSEWYCIDRMAAKSKAQHASKGADHAMKEHKRERAAIANKTQKDIPCSHHRREQLRSRVPPDGISHHTHTHTGSHTTHTHEAASGKAHFDRQGEQDLSP